MSYTDHLSKDKKLKKIMAVQGELLLKSRKDLFNYLCASIMSQQLSTKVASVIHQRFLDLFNGKTPLPEDILALPEQELRAIGLSNAKTAYIRHVAVFAIERGISFKVLQKMSDQEVIDYLTEIKGVGKWTVEMMLMFALGREDIFPVDDLGIQQAMAGLYKLNTENKKQLKEDMHLIAKKWMPYRTYASMYLWRWKDEGKNGKSKVENGK
jgi:DNA-3-methyladenine glycosylase II